MMHVIVRDDLVDHDYVSRYAVGYDALVERVQQVRTEARRRHGRPARGRHRAVRPR